MHFSTIVQIASLAVIATASVIPAEIRIATDVATIEERAALPNDSIEERQLLGTLAVTFLSAVATEAGTAITEQAITAIVAEIANIETSWDTARQSFTQEVTARMWTARPSSSYVGVACYNQAYSVQNPANVFGKVSAKITMGLLNTDYDCMYLSAPNAFYTEGDGGYQNVAFRYESPCTYSSSSGDLTCM